jgi:hypothetical protein
MLRLPPRQRRRLIKLGSIFILLFAVAPQVLYLGRPLTEDQAAEAVQSAPPGHEHHAKAAAEHAGHCHVSGKGCSGAAGPVQLALLESAIQLSNEDRRSAAVESEPLSEGFTLWQRPEKPPQPV